MDAVDWNSAGRVSWACRIQCRTRVNVTFQLDESPRSHTAPHVFLVEISFLLLSISGTQTDRSRYSPSRPPSLACKSCLHAATQPLSHFWGALTLVVILDSWGDVGTNSNHNHFDNKSKNSNSIVVIRRRRIVIVINRITLIKQQQ